VAGPEAGDRAEGCRAEGDRAEGDRAEDDLDRGGGRKHPSGVPEAWAGREADVVTAGTRPQTPRGREVACASACRGRVWAPEEGWVHAWWVLHKPIDGVSADAGRVRKPAAGRRGDVRPSTGPGFLLTGPAGVRYPGICLTRVSALPGYLPYPGICLTRVSALPGYLPYPGAAIRARTDRGEMRQAAGTQLSA